MNCDQIRSYLPDYAAGVLPRMKAAWVVQHLAGCPACAEALAARRAAVAGPSPCPDPAETQTAATAETGWLDVRRPVPRWVRPAAIALAALLVAGTGWVCLRPAGIAAAGAAHRTPQGKPLSFDSLPERKGSVTLTVAEVAAEGEEVRVRLSFAGSGLKPPVSPAPYIYLQPAAGSLAMTRSEVVRADEAGLQLDVRFDRALLAGADHFSLRVSGVHQVAAVTRTLTLPDPRPQVNPDGTPLAGAPGGLRLLSYGYAGHMLELQLGGPLATGPAGTPPPSVFLRDASNVTYAPTSVRLVPGNPGQNLALEFPDPVVVDSRLQLVAEWPEDRYLGPWLIDVKFRQ